MFPRNRRGFLRGRLHGGSRLGAARVADRGLRPLLAHSTRQGATEQSFTPEIHPNYDEGTQPDQHPAQIPHRDTELHCRELDCFVDIHGNHSRDARSASLRRELMHGFHGGLVMSDDHELHALGHFLHDLRETSHVRVV